MDEKCLVDWRNNPSRARGLCYGHYNAIARLVRMGKTSWERLVEAGKATQCKSRGAKGHGKLKEWALCSDSFTDKI